VNQPPFDSNMNNLIHAWCQWCVNHQRMVTLQDWMGYTHDGATLKLIQAVYQEKPARRIDIRALLDDPAKRKALMVDCLIATQAREGITTTRAQAEAAYEKVQAEIRQRAGEAKPSGSA
jgi:hypothetical protein